jgi:hypothetical protein
MPTPQGRQLIALTLPLNAAGCPKLSFAAVAGGQVFPLRPLGTAFTGYAQLLPMVIADPSCQFRRPWQPAENWVGFAKWILKPRWRSLHIICKHDIQLPWRDIQAGRLEKMHVKALLSMKVMETKHKFFCPAPAFMCDIIDDHDNFYDIVHSIYMDALFVQLSCI